MKTDQGHNTPQNDEPNPEVRVKRNWLLRLSLTRKIVETIGNHPLVAGILAFLAIFGFFVSFVGYVVDRQEARETTDQIADVQGTVDRVAETIESPCSSPPCWSLSDLMRASTIGRSKDLMDRKLPPADFVKNNQFVYSVENCSVYIEYRDNAVSYIAADLTYSETLPSGEKHSSSCPFDIPRIMDYTSFPGNEREEYSRKQYTEFPTDNTSVTLRDILGLTHDDIRISEACIECGNYADPYIEVYAFGSHAMGFIDFYFLISSYGYSDYDKAYDLWDQMRARFDAIGPDPDEYHFVETTDYCGKNVLPELAYLKDFNVDRVGVGRGARNWPAPSTLNCK